MNGYQPPVVIDNGSGMIKAGLAGTREPQFVYPNILGRTKGHNSAVEELCVGDQAQERRSFLSIRYRRMLRSGSGWKGAESPELKPPRKDQERSPAASASHPFQGNFCSLYTNTFKHTVATRARRAYIRM